MTWKRNVSVGNPKQDDSAFGDISPQLPRGWQGFAWANVLSRRQNRTHEVAAHGCAIQPGASIHPPTQLGRGQLDAGWLEASRECMMLTAAVPMLNEPPRVGIEETGGSKRERPQNSQYRRIRSSSVQWVSIVTCANINQQVADEGARMLLLQQHWWSMSTSICQDQAMWSSGDSSLSGRCPGSADSGRTALQQLESTSGAKILAGG